MEKRKIQSELFKLRSRYSEIAYPRFDITLEDGIYCPFCGCKIEADEQVLISCDHVLFIVTGGRFSHVNEESRYYEEPDMGGMSIDEFVEALDEKTLRIDFNESHLELGDGFIIFQDKIRN